MTIEIKIPKEFEDNFRRDRFGDALKRLRADSSGILVGLYEKEVADMLVTAFEHARIRED